MQAERPQGGGTAQALEVPEETARAYDTARQDDLDTSLTTAPREGDRAAHAAQQVRLEMTSQTILSSH
jgi:hypothetical protein